MCNIKANSITFIFDYVELVMGRLQNQYNNSQQAVVQSSKNIPYLRKKSQKYNITRLLRLINTPDFKEPLCLYHRYLSIYTACTACLVCFISTVNGCSKKKLIKTGTGSWHITNLKQSILETFNIYGLYWPLAQLFHAT